jgi:hypothetical protein
LFHAMTRRRLTLSGIIIAAVAAWHLSVQPSARGGALPEQLTGRALWQLSSELSEPDGYFRSDNLLSNEIWMQHVIPELVQVAKPGRVYMGVGPEQNFTYIAALKPALAFIVDIRRGNLQLHLMYKAIFELSSDRADFVARLFSRSRPATVSADSPIGDIFTAVIRTPGTDALFASNLAAVREQLTRSRGFPLTDEDLDGIRWILQSFAADGPLIQYSANFGRTGGFPTYAELMAATDAVGTQRSFLATEEAFTYLKSMQTKNLIVPVVGDFAGERALRGVGRYLKDKRTFVGAFYVSNVEQYLGRDGRWRLFCENVGTLPLEESSSFIRSIRDSAYGRGMGLNSVTGNMVSETRACPR